MKPSASVLVVEGLARQRSRFTRWLEEAGYDVLWCPGPSAPQYACTGVVSGSCALTKGLSVVVLDLKLESDHAMTGIPGWQILSYYGRLGLRVVAIAEPGDVLDEVYADRVAIVRRPAHRRALLAAVRQSIAAGPPGMGDLGAARGM